jgi:hypothetical protein
LILPLVRDPTPASRTLASAGQRRRLVNKARVVDLLDKKIGHIGARDESGAPSLEIYNSFDELAQRVVVERIELIGRQEQSIGQW